MNSVLLGKEVIDTITGFKGIAVARCEYMNGCIQYEVQPPLNSNKEWVKSKWIDLPQLEIVKEEVESKEGTNLSRTFGTGNTPEGKSKPSFYSSGNRGE